MRSPISKNTDKIDHSAHINKACSLCVHVNNNHTLVTEKPPNLNPESDLSVTCI